MAYAGPYRDEKKSLSSILHPVKDASAEGEEAKSREREAGSASSVGGRLLEHQLTVKKGDEAERE